MGNFIVSQQFYDEELFVYHTNDIDIKRYFADEFIIPKKYLQKAVIFDGNPPELNPPKVNLFGEIFGASNNSSSNTENDFENAVALHESMKINKVQASDERLWSYLCHVPYFKFIRDRYKPQRDMKELDLNNFYEYNDEKDRSTIRNYIKERFFTGTSNRSLRRNGLGFLWWAVELTKEPWERYEGIPHQGKEKYYYVKIILENPDLYSSTFERIIGKEPRIVFPLLDCIIENNFNRNQYREVIKKLNSDIHLFHYSLMPYKKVRNKIDKLIDNS